MKKFAALAFVLAVISCATVQRVVPPVMVLSSCVADDAVKKPPPTLATIALDCDADILAVVEALLKSDSAAVKASPAHYEARRLRAKLGAMQLPADDGPPR